MTMRKTLSGPGLAVLIALWTSPGLRAADTSVMPAPVTSPAMMPAAACPTCGGGSFSGTGTKTCDHCGNSWFHKHDKGPYVVTLCPGACFGYFQTQWRKWDDVCPYPYQGIGVSDAPRPPSPVLAVPTQLPPMPKSDAPIPGPRPVVPKSGDSKPMSSSGVPTIPQPGYGN